MPFKVNWGLVVAVLVWLGLALLMQWNKTYTNAWQLGLAGVLVLMLASARSVPRK
jgi:Na+-translocating ferredoxin:NAD+ oxidoreductase RnfE subunit